MGTQGPGTSWGSQDLARHHPLLVQEHPSKEPKITAGPSLEKLSCELNVLLSEITAGQGTPWLDSFSSGRHTVQRHPRPERWPRPCPCCVAVTQRDMGRRFSERSHCCPPGSMALEGRLPGTAALGASQGRHITSESQVQRGGYSTQGAARPGVPTC